MREGLRATARTAATPAAGSDSAVRLVLPVRAELWVLARMSASALATRLDFSLDAVDDLRLAIDELCNSCAAGAEPASVLCLDYSWDDDSLHVSCAVEPVADGPPSPGAAVSLGLSAAILEALVDEHEIGPVVDGRRLGWLTKRRPMES